MNYVLELGNKKKGSSISSGFFKMKKNMHCFIENLNFF